MLHVQARLVANAALMPYIVPAPKEGVVGQSKYADRLRKQVLAAARDTVRWARLSAVHSSMMRCEVALYLCRCGTAEKHLESTR